MKPPRLLLAVVLTIVGVACIAPFCEGVWMWVAYKAQTDKSTGVVKRVVRVEWFPGPRVVLQNQVCPECQSGVCSNCAEYWVARLSPEPVETRAMLDMPFRGKPIYLSAGQRISEQISERPVFVSIRAHCTCPTCFWKRKW